MPVKTKEIWQTSLGMRILTFILDNGPSHGGPMIGIVTASAKMYDVLHKLEDEGLLEAKQDNNVSTKRLIYSLTPKGNEYAKRSKKIIEWGFV
jgi:DNA-binding PadR family transcriptional regulator